MEEVGYRSMDRQAPAAVLRVRQPALERGGMILTGNQSFGSWGDDFRGQVMASAIRDRVVHHAVVIEHPGWFVSVEGRA